MSLPLARINFIIENLFKEEQITNEGEKFLKNEILVNKIFRGELNANKIKSMLLKVYSNNEEKQKQVLAQQEEHKKRNFNTIFLSFVKDNYQNDNFFQLSNSDVSTTNEYFNNLQERRFSTESLNFQRKKFNNSLKLKTLRQSCEEVDEWMKNYKQQMSEHFSYCDKASQCLAHSQENNSQSSDFELIEEHKNPNNLQTLVIWNEQTRNSEVQQKTQKNHIISRSKTSFFQDKFEFIDFEKKKEEFIAKRKDLMPKTYKSLQRSQQIYKNYFDFSNPKLAFLLPQQKTQEQFNYYCVNIQTKKAQEQCKGYLQNQNSDKQEIRSLGQIFINYSFLKQEQQQQQSDKLQGYE